MNRQALVRAVLGTLGVVCALNILFVPTPLSANTLHAGIHEHRKTIVTVTVSVSGTQPWTDPGIALSAGAVVSTTATGMISFAGGPGNSYSPTGKAGCVGYDESFVAPTLACFSLVARIGNSAPFEMGTGKRFLMRTSGHLGLGVNDTLFGDNSGNWTVTITVFDP